MKESEIIFESYDYIVFVDASGDDGYCFREKNSESSSLTYVSSCFVVKPQDIAHNTQILQDMKTVLNFNNNTELKSTILKRHRFRRKAYEKLNSVRGVCFSMIAFKKDILKKEKLFEFHDVKSKRLSGLTQSFPYYAIHKSGYFQSTDRILIVMDNMKKTEMAIVQKNLEEYGLQDSISEKYDLIFRDSQSDKYALIQIADIVAGTMRDYFEKNMPSQSISKSCWMCKTSSKCRSSHGKKLLKKVIFDASMENLLLLHTATPNKLIMLAGIITLPLYHFKYYKYIDCKLEYKKRS